jgi:hypothetical protein
LDAEGLIPLGNRDLATGRIVLSPKRTLPTAQAYIGDFHSHPDGRTLVSYCGLLMRWRNNRYCEIEDDAVRQQLQIWLHGALRYIFDRKAGEFVLVDFESNPTTINAALDSVRAFTHLEATTPSPSWLDGAPDGICAVDIVPCQSMLLHLPTMQHLAATPNYFAVNALDFDPDPSAPDPMTWHKFLHQLFEGDWQSLDLLKEWFGYCLTGDTSLQKMLLIVGPRRSGKGTIARVLTRLVGAINVCGPTTSSLAGAFGLQPLIGKSLAIVSDARFHGESIQTVIERLLCISGEDTLTIDRKFLGSVTMKLPTRFMFLTNEFPRLADASGALAGRFVVLKLTNSFFDKEEPRVGKIRVDVVAAGDVVERVHSDVVALRCRIQRRPVVVIAHRDDGFWMPTVNQLSDRQIAVVVITVAEIAERRHSRIRRRFTDYNLDLVQHRGVQTVTGGELKHIRSRVGEISRRPRGSRAQKVYLPVGRIVRVVRQTLPGQRKTRGTVVVNRRRQHRYTRQFNRLVHSSVGIRRAIVGDRLDDFKSWPPAGIYRTDVPRGETQ